MTELVLPPAPVFVLVGPPRVGKKTMITLAREIFPILAVGTSFTTSQQQAAARPDRYTYRSRDEIIEALSRGEVLEWSESGGEIYASCRPPSKTPTILVMDTIGAARVIAYHTGSLPITYIGVVPMVRYEDDERRSASEKQAYHQRKPKALERARLDVLRNHLHARGALSHEQSEALMLVAHAEMVEILTLWPERAHTHVIDNVDGRREEGVAQLARIIRDKIDSWRDECDRVRDQHIATLEVATKSTSSKAKKIKKQSGRKTTAKRGA